LRAQPQWNRILVTRMSAMGDIIHSLPAVAALRQAFPSALIGWVIEDRWADLISAPSASSQGCSPAQPLADVVHRVNTRAWRSSPLSAATRKEIKTVIGELKKIGYDVVIDLQAAIRSAVLGRLSGARTRIGFAKPRESLAHLFYTQAVRTPAPHVVEQGMQLAESISGRNDLHIEFPFPRDVEAESWCAAELRRNGIGNFVMMNPGAGWGAKCWPVARYGALAKQFKNSGLATIANVGPGEETLAGEIEAASEGAAKAISCSLAQLIALTSRAQLFVGGDTGPVHLAAAQNVPVVAIYGPTNPVRNGPYGPHGTNGNRIVVLRSAESKTSHARRSVPESGLLQITVEEVFSAASKLLGGLQ
jgi:heptosyltransferase-1